jgi:hypothetical protein
MGKRPWHVQVATIGTRSFLKAVKEFKTQLSAGQIMANVVWDSEGVIHVDFIPHGVTVNV